MKRSKKLSSSLYLSIIIVNYNTKRLLVNCIRSIYNSTHLTDFEIIVVDNKSDDGSEILAKESFPDIVLIKNQANRGFAKANNQAIQIAKGKFILFLNPDTFILPRALDKTIAFLEGTTDVAMVGCRILNPNGSLQYSCRSFPSLWDYLFESLFLHKLFPRSRWAGRFYGTDFSYDKVKVVDVILGAFMMNRKQALEEVGYFDERFFIYSEETDLCYRMSKNKKKVCFYPDAEIIHYGQASASQYPLKMSQQDHRSRFLFMRKHHKPLTVWLSVLIIFFGIVLRLIFWCLAVTCRMAFSRRKLPAVRQKVMIFSHLLAWYLRFGFLQEVSGQPEEKGV